MSRAIRFFKEADVEEAAFVLQRGTQILSERTPLASTPRPRPKRKRRPITALDRAEEQVS
jgi:hypothetical protein